MHQYFVDLFYFNLTEYTEKYLPALRCLLAAYRLNPDHPKCHEQGCRFRLALDNPPEPLPQKVQEVINTTFLSKFASKSVEEDNEDYLESHKDSPAHIQSAVRVRNILNPGSDDTKSKGAKDLESAVALDVASLQEAIDGLHLSDEIGAGSEARESYLEAARKQWPEASVFKSSH